jgi:hypothetical protein
MDASSQQVIIREPILPAQPTRLQLLEALWESIKSSENWRVGYNPKFTEAVQNMHKLEAGNA